MPVWMKHTKEERKKPAIIKLFDYGKGETDIVDQRMGNFTTGNGPEQTFVFSWTLHE